VFVQQLQAPDIQTLPACYISFESCVNFREALSARACELFPNTNTSQPLAQHVFTRFPICFLNSLRQVFQSAGKAIFQYSMSRYHVTL
jgi:hypothetical protein